LSHRCADRPRYQPIGGDRGKGSFNVLGCAKFDCSGSLFRAAEAQKGADFVEREAKLTRAPDEHKDAKVDKGPALARARLSAPPRPVY
jgi:hypothetical protein